ncbi:MAG: VOC family protein [Gemmatimonadota bacterium]|nr:VOC family protein [Gemmatimonadota bacterium]
MKSKPRVGTIAWTDLTVPDAATLRDFYAKVVGWHHEPVDMGGYDDFTMLPSPDGEPIAGVCNARGPNADLPPQWLNYIVVADLDESVRVCRSLGGSVIVGPKAMNADSRYCVIRDPAGAVVALFATIG